MNKIKATKKSFPKAAITILTILILFVIGTSVWGYGYFKSTKVINNSVKTPDSHKYPKVIVFGIDAASWRIIDPLIADGKMPNLQSLIKQGVKASVKPPNPTISPAIWTTVATGMVPEKHGIRNFLTTAKDYEERFVSSDKRNVKALWNILSDNGMSVGTFSWWATHPPEQFNGYSVTDLSLLDPKKGILPQSLQEKILTNSIRILGTDIFSSNLNLLFPDPKDINDPHFYEVAADKIGILEKMYNSNNLFAFDEIKPDILMQIYGGIDVSQHIFLKFLYPDEYPSYTDPNLIEKYKSYIIEQYIRQDELLGEYIKRSGPETNIIVISDHGFFIDPATGYRFTKFNLLLSHLGYLYYNSDNTINFNKTIAFECNNNTFDWHRRLCINISGRYGSGIIDPKNYESVRSKIIQDLKNITNKSGESLFSKVDISSESINDVEYDIKQSFIHQTIKFNSQYHNTDEYLELSIESGNHYSNPVGPEGMLVWKGPHIQQNISVDIKHVDLAPNILTALGLPIGRDMDGKFIPDLFTDDIVPTYIETYETNPKKITIQSFRSIEDNEDSVSIDGFKVQTINHITGDDLQDEICYELSDPSKYALKIDSLSITDHSGKHLNEIEDQIPRLIHFDELSTNTETTYNLNELVFPNPKPNTFQLKVPLDIMKPPTLALWTNVAFLLETPTSGTLRIIAKGEPAGDIWPSMSVDELTDNQTVTIDSKTYKSFDLLVSKGLISVKYINDGQVGLADRNMYIQNILFQPDGFSINKDITFTRTNHGVCVHNNIPGNVHMDFRFISNIDESESTDINEQALDFIENTTQIKNNN